MPYSSTEEEEKEEDSFLNVLCESWGKNEDSKGPKKDIRAARKTDKGKCWREGTFVRVYICTTIRTIYEG